MALHRDIYWVGRQWAVTGHGLQAVDQRLKGAFDILGSRVWEENLAESLRQLAWFKEADFDKALAVARERFPAPPQTPAEPMPPAELGAPVSAAPPCQPRGALELRTQGRLAKFLPQWRIRH